MAALEVRWYRTPEGRIPLSEWVDELRDSRARSRIVTRMDRLSLGLLGDWRSVGEGVRELRYREGSWLLERLPIPQAFRFEQRTT
jgi:putative component of toxin-antitoxin plasmid stabilization module